MTAPANDNFADATVLTGALPITLTGETNVDATTEVDEPTLIDYGYIDPGDEYDGIGTSVWYAWTCGTSGTYRFHIDTDFDSVLTVYTGGTAFADLERVDQSEQGWFDPYFEVVYFDATASETYYFQVAGYDSATGDIDLELAAFTRPANDDFADAETLTGASDSASGSSFGATTEVDEPRGESGGSYFTTKTVWYKWSAPELSRATIAVARSGGWGEDPTTDTLAIYTGSSLASLVEVLAPSAVGSHTFVATPGTTYFIQVGGRAGFSVTEGDFDISLTTDTDNNDYFLFARELVLSGGSAALTGDTTDATVEDDEVVPFEGYARTLWWKWTAPFDGEAEVDVSDIALSRTATAVWSGGTILADLELVASHENSGTAPITGFAITEDETYYIQLSQESYLFIPEGGSVAGAVLRASGPPANDDWQGTLITLSGGSATVTADNRLASEQAGEPRTFAAFGFSGTVSDSVWFNWTPDADGVARFDTFGSDFDTTAAVFTGGSLSGLTCLAFNDNYEGGTVTIDQSQISWAALEDTTYYLQVASAGTVSGSITAHLYFNAYPTGDPPPPPPPLTVEDPYRIELRTLNSAGFTVTTESLELVNFSCNWRLNGPGAFEGSGVVGVTQADASNVGARELIVYKGSGEDETAIWGGYLSFFDVDEDTKRVRIAADGHWARARSRLMRGNQIYKPITNSGVAWKADQIAWDVIDQAQGATYGDMGWVYGGHSGTRKDCKRIYYGVDRNNVGEAIEALAREGFFDFSVDVHPTPSSGAVATFRTWYERGSNLSGSINLSASNAMTLNYSLASTDMATVIDVFGSVEGCRGVAATEEQNLATYGRLEARPIDMETDEQGEVDETAARFIAQHGVPAKNATVTYMEGVGPDLTDYDLGDTIRVSPADGYVSNFDGRVVGRELAVEAGRAVITVEVER